MSFKKQPDLRPVEKALRIDPEGLLSYVRRDFALAETRDLAPAGHDSGLSDGMRVQEFLQRGDLTGLKKGAVARGILFLGNADSLGLRPRPR